MFFASSLATTIRLRLNRYPGIISPLSLNKRRGQNSKKTLAKREAVC
jgi:hypothetical protein